MTLNLDDLDLYTGALGCSTLVMEFFSIFIRILGRSLLLLYEGFICNIKKCTYVMGVNVRRFYLLLYLVEFGTLSLSPPGL